MALVVIEGIDKAGKSTLAERLAARWNRDYNELTHVVHCEQPKTRPATAEYVKQVEGYLPAGIPREHYVFDRSFVGEAVWPIFFNRTPRLNKREFALLAQLYASKGALFVRAKRPLDQLVEEFRQADPPEPLKIPLIPAAIASFEQVFHWLHRHGAETTTWNMTNDPQGDEVRRRAEQIQSMKDRKQFSFPKEYKHIALEGLDG